MTRRGRPPSTCIFQRPTRSSVLRTNAAVTLKAEASPSFSAPPACEAGWRDWPATTCMVLWYGKRSSSPAYQYPLVVPVHLCHGRALPSSHSNLREMLPRIPHLEGKTGPRLLMKQFYRKEVAGRVATAHRPSLSGRAPYISAGLAAVPVDAIKQHSRNPADVGGEGHPPPSSVSSRMNFDQTLGKRPGRPRGLQGLLADEEPNHPSRSGLRPWSNLGHRWICASRGSAG